MSSRFSEFCKYTTPAPERCNYGVDVDNHFEIDVATHMRLLALEEQRVSADKKMEQAYRAHDKAIRAKQYALAEIAESSIAFWRKECLVAMAQIVRMDKVKVYRGR